MTFTCPRCDSTEFAISDDYVECRNCLELIGIISFTPKANIVQRTDIDDNYDSEIEISSISYANGNVPSGYTDEGIVR